MANETTKIVTEEKAAFNIRDIMHRYGVGETKAYNLLRRIEFVNNGLVLGRGHVLLTELQFYEKNRGRRPGMKNLPTDAEIDEWIKARIVPDV